VNRTRKVLAWEGIVSVVLGQCVGSDGTGEGGGNRSKERRKEGKYWCWLRRERLMLTPCGLNSGRYKNAIGLIFLRQRCISYIG
jgi:hypothetical protein